MEEQKVLREETLEKISEIMDGMFKAHNVEDLYNMLMSVSVCLHKGRSTIYNKFISTDNIVHVYTCMLDIVSKVIDENFDREEDNEERS